MYRFFKTTVVGGVLFILPLVLIFALVEKAIHLLRIPLGKLLPLFDSYDVAGITLISLAAAVGLIAMCFLAGLLAKTKMASSALETLEVRVLGNLPGYQLFKDMSTRMAGLDDDGSTKVGMIAEGDGWRLCLVLDAVGDWVTIYMPDGGPAGGTAGEVRLMPASQVVTTDVTWLPLVASLRRGGRGALEMMEPWLPKP